jgi:predicted NBD/HSP70 family sugar kinase
MMTPNQASPGELLHLIRSGRATTRADLQRATGLSRSTVGQRLDLLNRAGWLRHASGASTGGRPSHQLAFEPTHAAVIAIDLETRHARAAVLDLAGTILAEHVAPLYLSDGPDHVLDQLARWFPDLITAAGIKPGHICGIGLSVPGPVEWETGRVVQPPIMPGWDQYPIRERMQDAYAHHVGHSLEDGPVPVFVDNDANLMALAEYHANHRDCSAFVLVKVSTGIGAGVVVGNDIYRGIDGGAGDIGHIRLHDRPDALCMCGSHGCLAAVASGGALADQLSKLGIDTASGSGSGSGSDVKRLLAEGHPDAIRLAREAGRRAGEVLVTVVTLLNPGVLMLAGDLSGVPFMTGVRELLYQRAMPRTTANLQIVTSRLGDHSGLIGAAAMVVDFLYSPARADARLHAHAG